MHYCRFDIRDFPPFCAGDGRDRHRPDEPRLLGSPGRPGEVPAVRGERSLEWWSPHLPAGLQSTLSSEWLRVQASPAAVPPPPPSQHHSPPQCSKVPPAGTLQVTGSQKTTERKVRGGLSLPVINS